MRNIDRQTVMMVCNFVIGALGGLALTFLTADVRTMSDAGTGAYMGAVGFSIVAIVMQATRPTRIIGAVCAFMFFTSGVIVLYVLAQQMYPDVIPATLTDELAQFVVRVVLAASGILATMLWWRVNPYTPVPPISLKFERKATR